MAESIMNTSEHYEIIAVTYVGSIFNPVSRKWDVVHVSHYEYEEDDESR